MSELPSAEQPTPAGESESEEEVSNDAMQLIGVATFNGFCRLIAALSENGLLRPGDLRSIHDGMVEPLDDPGLRDDEVVLAARQALESGLASAVAVANQQLDR